MEINRDGDSIARCRDNNDSTYIKSNTEHQGKINGIKRPTHPVGNVIGRNNWE